ncbi:periplasmic Sensor Hybrid Histidine Kinase [gamma proteobacterium HTCC5015]|nr:periplasmic Sensor Hybrid Histidine Kinase [gamma proteobacterium HTCC5015]
MANHRILNRLQRFRFQPLEEEVEHERITTLVKGTVPHLYGGQLIPIFIFFVFYSHASRETLWAWVLISLFSAFISAIFVYYYLKHEHLFSAKQWGQFIVALLLILALCRAVAAPMFIGSDTYLKDIVLIIMMLGVSTGGAVALASYLPACFVFVVPVLGTLSWAVWQHDIANGGFLAILALAYGALLLAQATKFNRILVSNIRLRIDYDKAYAAMNQANAAKARFLSAASHDIRQPLQAINLFVSAIESNARNSNNGHLFDNLNNSVSGVSTLLNHLLEITTLDEGGIQAHKKNMDLKDMLTQLHQRFNGMAKEKGLTLELLTKDAAVHSDPELLERILSNLIVNAIKHTDSGSVVIRSRRVDTAIEVSIEDTGPGIPESEQEGIFEAFYQLNNPQRDRSKGSGLGLAIVKGFCDLLAHPIWLESEVGQGSRFYLKLPLANENVSEQRSAAEPTITPWQLDNTHVLVLDDDRAILEGMNTVLEKWGCHSQCAESLDQALKLCETQTPDIIISDFNLSGDQNGLTSIEALRKQCNRNIPAVIISGELNHPELEQAKQTGWMVLSKPVKPGELRTALNYARKQHSEL